MNRKRPVGSRIVVLGAAGLFVFAALWLLFRVPDAAPGSGNGGEGGGNDNPGRLNFPSLHLYVHDGDAKQWTLTLLNASVSSDQRLVQSAAIRNGTFYENNAVAAHFTAGAAVFNQGTRDLDLSGPIVVDAVNGAHLTAGSLHYTFATHRIHAEGPLNVVVKDLKTGLVRSTFSAGKVDADLALNELTVEPTTKQPVIFTSRLSPSGAF